MNSIPPIRMLVLTLTGRCNFSCRYCYASDVDAVDMNEETAVEAVMMAGASGERFLLQFSGGEPLLWPLWGLSTLRKERRRPRWSISQTI